VGVSITRGLPPRAATIALTTAYAETGIRNLDHGDRDSVGLFQQRPSQGWGTEKQLLDPYYSTGKFYDALLKVKGWQNLSVEQAAQAVQKSADGSLYARWDDRSRILAAALTGEAAGAVGCTIVDEPAQRGATAAAALAQGVTADWGELRTVDKTGLIGLALAVDAPRTGWQYAHWLVSHAADRNIRSVRFGDQVWTAKAASWKKSDAPSPDQVVAEVYN